MSLKQDARELQRATGWTFMRCREALRNADGYVARNELLNRLLAEYFAAQATLTNHAPKAGLHLEQITALVWDWSRDESHSKSDVENLLQAWERRLRADERIGRKQAGGSTE